MIKVYRKGNFTTSHERTSLRNICNLINEHFEGEEDVYLLANIDLHSVTYTFHTQGKERRKKIHKSSPDLIIIKNDSIAVVEMKGHPGMIRFPLKNDELFKGEWTSKFKDFPEQIINEGSYNPYNQVNTNRQAFVAFLRMSEKKFSSEDLQGSDWDKTSAFILFTNNTVQFAHSMDERNQRGNWFHIFHLGALNETKNGEFFPNFVKDMTTGPRVYKKDERSEISFSKECVQKLCELLECKDVTEEYLGQEVDDDDDDPSLTSAVGFAPTLVRGTIENRDEELEESFRPSTDVLNLPRELRILSYYRRCLMEESKHGMNIFLNTKRADEKRYNLGGIRETIFSGNEPMKIPDEALHLLHTNLRQQNPSLSYGFSVLVEETEISGKNYWVGAPLFSTRVHYNNGSYQIAYENDIIVNQRVLAKIRPFSDLHHSELEEKIDKIIQEDSTPSFIIKKIFEEMGLLEHMNIEELMVLRSLDFNNLEKGFKPGCGLIYLSESGIYTNLLKELRLIEKNWRTKLKRDEEIDDLAYQFLKGLDFPNNDEWLIPLYNVGYSNYEQSLSIGSATNEKNPLTVVSGPPGTGKSQLGMNLIAETNRKDQKIIFSSRNHKAVDVITDRYNSLFTNKEAIKRIATTAANKKKANTSKFATVELSKNDRTIANSKVMAYHKKLTDLRKNIEDYEEALGAIDDVNMELQQILQENPNLQIIDWHIDDPKKLKLPFWKEKLSEFEKKKKSSQSILSRVVHAFTEGELTWSEIISQESFIEKYKKQIFDELKNSLSEDIVDKIGKDKLYEFAEEYLPLLNHIEDTSTRYKKYNSIISNYDLMDLFEEWNEQSAKNIENSIKLLDDKLFTTPNKTSIFNTAVTTLSASRLDKFEPGYYDLAVMDESSQTDIISAIPILYRAKRAIIIGDEKQLFPIVSIDEEKDYNTFLAYNLEDKDYYECGYAHSSLLSVADNQIKRHNRRRTMLKEHFRCHPNIIQFSNRYFYNNDLRIKTSKENEVGIKWVEHNDDCQPRWTNQSEVNLVIKLIKDSMETKNYDPTQIGVVTPFREQANVITNLISQTFGSHVGEGILSDTAHRFQGDEREIIIFSLVVGPSMPTSTFKWVQEGKSRNLINVAITRAKKELIIVGNRNNINHRGGLLNELSDWVDYCSEME
jgi:hypothetical protein